jgi:uncharacterized protein YukE
MNNNTIFNYTDVEGLCTEMHGLSTNIKNSLDNIESLNNQVGGLWIGPASEHYVEKSKKLISNFEPIYKELEYAILYMAKCSSGYKSIDDKILTEICNNLNITEPNLSGSNIFPSS